VTQSRCVLLVHGRPRGVRDEAAAYLSCGRQRQGQAADAGRLPQSDRVRSAGVHHRLHLDGVLHHTLPVCNVHVHARALLAPAHQLNYELTR